MQVHPENSSVFISMQWIKFKRVIINSTATPEKAPPWPVSLINKEKFVMECYHEVNGMKLLLHQQKFILLYCFDITGFYNNN